MENVKNLQGLINYTGTVSEKDLLINILHYAQKKLGCGGGSAFSFDNATHRLMLKANTWNIEKPFSLPLGEGIAGTAAKAPDQYTLFSGEALNNSLIPFDYPPQEDLIAVVAMPVSNFDVPEVVFCFDVYEQDIASDHVKDLKLNGRGPLHDFWLELRALDTRAAIHRIRMHRIPRKIYEAGLAAGNLTREVARFITRFQKELAKTHEGEKPDLIYVQLVDPFQNLVRTIQGVGAHQGLQVISAHALKPENGNPPDINVDVINTRRVEIISGWDDRFDPHVYKRYGHENYVRMWLPLFPFPLSNIALRCSNNLRTYIEKNLLWQTNRSPDVDQAIHQTAEWKQGTTPPERLIYGTLEVGYKLDNPAAQELSHEDHDLVVAIISAALETSEDLYHSTIPGILDQIGALSANVPAFKKTIFTFFDPNRGRSEKRVYPVQGFWSSSVPVIEAPIDRDICSFLSKNGPSPISDEKVVRIDCKAKKKEDFPENLQKLPIEQLSDQYCKDLCRQNEAAATTTVNIAFQLHKAAMTPFELMEQRIDEKNVGTFRKDSNMEAFVEDIAHSYVALLVFYQDFRKIYKAGEPEKRGLEGRPEHVFPAGTLPEVLQGRFNIDDLKDKVKNIAYFRTPDYRDDYIRNGEKFYPLCLLPLELSEGSIGVLAIIFQNGVILSETLRRGLEGQAPYWAYRLSMHRLSLHRRFTRLMHQFRQDIAQAGSVAENNKDGEDPSKIFLKEVLKSALGHLKAKAAVITRNLGRSSGPARIYQYWCIRNKDDELQTNDIELFSPDLILECLNNIVKQEFNLINGPQSRECARKMLNTLEKESEKLLLKGHEADADKLFKLEAVYETVEQTDAILNFSIQNPDSSTSEESIQEKTTFSLIMPELHYFDRNQQQMVKELGTLIRHTMARVQSKQRERLRERLIRQAEKRLHGFEKAESIDELVGVFLRGLGQWSPDKEESGLKKEDYMGAADTVVFWTLSRTYDELVARSIRNEGLGSFDNPIDVIPPEKHPFLYEERKFIVKKKASHLYPIYKKEFEILTFDLSSIPEKDDIKSVKQAYNQRTSAKWMISFPLVDGANRLSGVVDLLRDQPFTPVEETVFREVFVRLSRRLNAAAERINHQKSKKLTDELFFKIREHIKEFKISDIYQGLVEEIREKFHCKHCDLFVEKDDRYVLYATTHESGPKSERERDQFYFSKPVSQIKDEDILISCVQTKMPSASHQFDFKKHRDEKYSPKLWEHLNRIRDKERLVFPIRLLTDADQDKPAGLFQLHGPNETINYKETKGGKKLKKNLRFSIEDYMLGRDIGLALYRIIKIVQLAEQQIWLVRELGHSLGQPLEVLRAMANQCLRALHRTNVDKDENKSLSDGINKGFDLVHDALMQLTYFHSVYTSSIKFEIQDLAKQVKVCCDSMAETARKRKIRIDYSEVRSIHPVPFSEGWMRIIVLNLLHNACKYSWEGMTVEVSLKEIDRIIYLKVTNSGIGIPDNERDHIYKLYFRSCIPDRRGVRPGTGIGLFIVKNGVKRVHQGEILVDSQPENERDRELIQKTGKIENFLYRTCFTVLLYRERLENSGLANQSGNEQRNQVINI